MTATDLGAALDDLYAVPLNRFTEKRNELARSLAPHAAAIKALKKPNTAAWAINQVVRAHPDEVEALFAATDRLRHAQRRVLSGGKATDLRGATDERNGIVALLTKLAETILVAAGHAGSQSTLTAVSDSFVAVATDDTGAELLRKGRLTRELTPGSLVDVGGLTLVPDAEPSVPVAGEPDRTAISAARRRRDEARAALKAAREAAKAANVEAARREIEADEAVRRGKVAQEQADFSRRAAEARQSELEQAEEVLAAAEQALHDAGERSGS